MSARIDRTGMRFGKWTIGRELRRVGKARCPVYECTCDCGNVVEVAYNNIASGNSTRCRECQFDAQRIYRVGSIVNGQRIVSFGKRRDSMVIRCEKCRFLRRHGTDNLKKLGCPKCRTFPPADAHGRMIEFDGETHNVAGWAKRIGITREGMRLRLQRLPLREALTTPRAA